MHTRTYQKRQHRRVQPAQTVSRNTRVIRMPQQEIMHGPVPVARETVPADAVPPRGVEEAVGVAGEFGEEVEEDLPDAVPRQEILHHEREEEVEKGPGELGETGGEAGAGGVEEEGGLHDRVDVGGRDNVHDEEGAEEGEEFFGDVGPADGGVARVFEFVDDGGEGDVEEVVGGSEVGGVVVGCELAGAGEFGGEGGDFGGDQGAEGGKLVVG